MLSNWYGSGNNRYPEMFATLTLFTFSNINLDIMNHSQFFKNDVFFLIYELLNIVFLYLKYIFLLFFFAWIKLNYPLCLV